MLIITGPGRSGTSVLALFCQKMGFDPGGDWYDVVDAGLENRQVVTINDALLRELRTAGTTAQTLEQYGEQMRQMSAAVVKDPRFTFHPGVLRAWYEVRKDLVVVLTYRTPEHCFSSRQRHPRFLRDRRSPSPDRMRCQMADCIEMLLALEIRFRPLLFPQFLGRFDLVYESLSALGLKLERGRACRIWAETVDLDKVHVGGRDVSPMDSKRTRHDLTTGILRNWTRLFSAHGGLSDSLADEEERTEERGPVVRSEEQCSPIHRSEM